VIVLLWAARIALLASAVTAVILARRRRDHRSFAIFLVWLTCVDGVCSALVQIRPLDAPPLTGTARLAFHVETALSLSTSAALAITAIVLFGGARRIPAHHVDGAEPSGPSERTAPSLWPLALIALAWAGAVVYVSALYPDPAVRGEGLRRIYLAGELSAVMVALGMIVRWTWRRLPPTPARIALLGVVLGDAVVLLFGAMRWGLWTHYALDQIAAVMLFVTLTAYQVISWRYSSSS
jgi:hypothetical protein